MMKNSVQVIRGIMFKQMVDMTRNKRSLLIVFIFPVFFVILNQVAPEEFGSDGSAFILMHSILVPILLMATIVAEEKEKGTLKLLMMSGVKIYEYFVGVAVAVMGYIIIAMMIFEISGATKNFDYIYVATFTVGSDIISLLLGTVIGGITKNQTNVGSVAVPIVLVIFFLPVFQLFKQEFTFPSKYLYSGILLKIMQECRYTTKDIVWMLINFIIVAILFFFVFRKKKIIKYESV